MNMWEPKLLARLDSIKHHLMTGMAPPFVIDEIECLQRDIEREMKSNRDQDYIPGNGDILGTRKKHRPGYELKRVFTKTEDIYFDTTLRFDTRDYPMDAKVLKTPQSSRFEGDIYRSKDGWIFQLKIEPQATQGEKGIGGELLRPISIQSNPHPKPDCPEYVESPPPTWRRDELRKWQYPQGED